jgi:hypothetical protein
LRKWRQKPVSEEQAATDREWRKYSNKMGQHWGPL